MQVTRVYLSGHNNQMRVLGNKYQSGLLDTKNIYNVREKMRVTRICLSGSTHIYKGLYFLCFRQMWVTSASLVL